MSTFVVVLFVLPMLLSARGRQPAGRAGVVASAVLPVTWQAGLVIPDTMPTLVEEIPLSETKKA